MYYQEFRELRPLKFLVLLTYLMILRFRNLICLTDYTLFFYKQHFYKQRQAEIGKKSSKC